MEPMMDELKVAFRDVMYKYQKPFTDAGLGLILEQWRNNKAELLDLLRRHPQWREEELAIVFDVQEHREIDQESVEESRFELTDMAERMFADGQSKLPVGRLEDFEQALRLATETYSRLLPETNVEQIKRLGRIECTAGQKTSRVVNRLCLKIGLQNFVEKGPGGEMRKRYNSVFARLADALNPITVPKKAVLSIHPCDFIEMSNEDDTWRSCHNFRDGGYKGGCLSYLGDAPSMIFFTVDNGCDAQFHKAPRLTREIFCYNGGVLLQSRCYPSDNEDQRDEYRAIVQQAIATCLGMPKLWKVNSEKKDIQGYWSTTEHSSHYTDYNCGYATLSLLKGWDGYGHLQIGSVSRCLSCGEHIHSTGELLCPTCKEKAPCKICGKLCYVTEGWYKKGGFYCRECAYTCDSCSHLMVGQEYTVFNRRGLPLKVCKACHDRVAQTCSHCSTRDLCIPIRGMEYCRQSENGLAA